MRAAIARAGILPADVGYLNLHGTATPHNDAMESLAVAEVLGVDVPQVSIKGKTNEGVDSMGHGESIAVHAVALVQRVRVKGAVE